MMARITFATSIRSYPYIRHLMASSIVGGGGSGDGMILFDRHRRYQSYYARAQQQQQKQKENDGQDGDPLLNAYKLSIEQDKLYPEHIHLSTTQRIALSIGSAVMALADPYRDDMVATFGETTGQYALPRMYQQMASHPEGRQILLEKPRISSATIDIEALGRLPTNTFGYAYYRFLTKNKVSPDTRKEVRFVDDIELAYVMQRYRETHDMVHALLNMPTNMLGEVLVKWIEAIQTGLPMCWLGGVFGPIQLKTRRARDFYRKEGLNWALKCGHEANDLLSIYYEKRFEQDLNDLRNELRIPLPIPRLPGFKGEEIGS